MKAAPIDSEKDQTASLGDTQETVPVDSIYERDSNIENSSVPVNDHATETKDFKAT